MEDEEDVIVKEVYETFRNMTQDVSTDIPIYLSKQLEDQLYLFQFPLRPSNLRYDSSTIRQCSIKPQHQEIKMEIAMDVNSPNFDMRKAEDIANTTDGSSDKEVFFKNNMMDSHTFASVKAVEDSSKYAVGVVHDDGIHVTPLKGILQLRPTFPFLDKRLRDSDRVAEESAAEEQVQQVTVKFAQADNERIKRARERSFNYLSKKVAEEPWCHTEWFHPQSDTAELERMKLISESQENVGHTLDLPARQYLRMLVPRDREEAAVVPQLPAHVISLNALKQLPLLEQCKLLLKDAKIISFQQLMLLLAGEGLNMDTVLKTLPQVANLIRGNWVVRSDVLYPKDTFSSTSGVPAHIMCRARDYVLYLFTRSQYVDRRKVSSVIKLPTEEVKEIFTGIARLRSNKGWELLLHADNLFIEKYPDIVQRQNMLWEGKQKQFNELLNNNKHSRQRRKSKSVGEETSKHNGLKRDSTQLSDDSDSNNKKSPVPAKKPKIIKNDAKSVDI